MAIPGSQGTLAAQLPDPFGAHVGVIVGEDAILHLCAEVARPVVWTERDFADRTRYRVRLGARRLRQAAVSHR